MILATRIAAERKLDEITGGIKLSEEFKNRLAENGLDLMDGYRIYNTIKDYIKKDKVLEDGVSDRIQSLMNQIKEEKGISKVSDISQDSAIERPDFYGHHESDNGEEPSVSPAEDEITVSPEPAVSESSTSSDAGKTESSDSKTESDKEYETIESVFDPKDLEKWADENKVKELKFLLNQEQNIRPCPNCGEIILIRNKFCYKCGCEISKFTGVPKGNVKKAKQEQDEDIAFKFAYVIYLDQVNRLPSKKVSENKYLKDYNVKVSQLKEQAFKDGYLEDGNPLAEAKLHTVKELQAILKDHDLVYSGKKADLVKRLGENLSEDELKKLFPKKLLYVTDKGVEFIENNRYVLYYDKTVEIRNKISIKDYDSLFKDVDDLSDKNIITVISDFILRVQDFLISRNQWGEYTYSFFLLAILYGDLKDDNKTLDVLFKLFISLINNYSQSLNKPNPKEGFIDKGISAYLVNFLNGLNLDDAELKTKFYNAYDGLKYPEIAMDKEELFSYLLRVIYGEDTEALTEEIHSKYA